MAVLSNNAKVRPDHQDRAAMVYVRQSTLAQVRQHTGSTQRQYDLCERARALGWPAAQIEVIDADQGQSGASSAARDGFQRLVAEVGLGRVGAVFCLEASRLARSCSDWYRLLEICALADTLVIDEDGVYDPGQYNDRLLLGFKGTMSEAELHWLRQRLQGGLLEKARQGTLRLPLPTGFVYDPAGRVVLDPDEAVQAAIRLALAEFERAGSALAVVRHFREQQLLFPTRCRQGARKGELVWAPLYYRRLIELLHHPCYAGAFVYGRAPRARPRPGDPAAAPVIMHREAHPGYLSWEAYERNQQRLTDNRSGPAGGGRGPARDGAALLAGIVLCGRCGRRMTARYQQDRTTPAYQCRHVQRAGPGCQWVQAPGVDAAVTGAVWEALAPAQLALAVAALEQVEARARALERQRQLQRERAAYEADLARRRFVAVEPENRLVARTLEREWNERLAELTRLEQEDRAPAGSAVLPLAAGEREQILALARDLPAVWTAPTTTNAERKRLIRLLIADVTLTREGRRVRVAIRWQTGAVSEREVFRPPKLWERYPRTDPAAITRLGELAAGRSDRETAACLSAEGFRTARGHRFTRAHVAWLRSKHQIPAGGKTVPAVPSHTER